MNDRTPLERECQGNRTGISTNYVTKQMETSKVLNESEIKDFSSTTRKHQSSTDTTNHNTNSNNVIDLTAESVDLDLSDSQPKEVKRVVNKFGNIIQKIPYKPLEFKNEAPIILPTGLLPDDVSNIKLQSGSRSTTSNHKFIKTASTNPIVPRSPPNRCVVAPKVHQQQYDMGRPILKANNETANRSCRPKNKQYRPNPSICSTESMTVLPLTPSNLVKKSNSCKHTPNISSFDHSSIMSQIPYYPIVTVPTNIPPPTYGMSNYPTTELKFPCQNHFLGCHRPQQKPPLSHQLPSPLFNPSMSEMFRQFLAWNQLLMNHKLLS